MRGQFRAAFVRTYGVRGQVALVAASHLCGDDWMICGIWPCTMCPMQAAVRGNMDTTCYEAAMGVYTRLIEELGRMPKKERRSMNAR